MKKSKNDTEFLSAILNFKNITLGYNSANPRNMSLIAKGLTVFKSVTRFILDWQWYWEKKLIIPSNSLNSGVLSSLLVGTTDSCSAQPRVGWLMEATNHYKLYYWKKSFDNILWEIVITVLAQDISTLVVEDTDHSRYSIESWLMDILHHKSGYILW